MNLGIHRSGSVRQAAWRAGLAAALLLSLALAWIGCEYPGVPHPLAAGAEDVRQGEPPPRANPGEPAAAYIAAPGAPQQPAASAVQVSLQDFRLEPERLTVKAGTVTFTLKNEGRYTHDFRIEGQGVDDKAPKVGQGRTFKWETTVPPGSYRISCPISNHADRGMTGTLEAVP